MRPTRRLVRACAAGLGAIATVTCVFATASCRNPGNGDEELANGRTRPRPPGASGEAPGPVAEVTRPFGRRVELPPFEDQVERLAQARCDRENRCGGVGPGGRWTTRDTCLASTRMQSREDLEAAGCPTGVASEQLDACLADIGNDSCDQALDVLSRIAACRSADLCRTARR
jgi:hypothetical protein